MKNACMSPFNKALPLEGHGTKEDRSAVSESVLWFECHCGDASINREWSGRPGEMQASTCRIL